jgi:hypothetical protein
MFVLLTTSPIQKRSAESRRPSVKELANADPWGFADDPGAPWPVRRGGWIVRLYEHSLGLAFVLLFLITWVGHALGGFAECAAHPVRHHQPRRSPAGYLVLARFWFNRSKTGKANLWRLPQWSRSRYTRSIDSRRNQRLSMPSHAERGR